MKQRDQLSKQPIPEPDYLSGFCNKNKTARSASPNICLRGAVRGLCQFLEQPPIIRSKSITLVPFLNAQLEKTKSGVCAKITQ